MPNVKSIPHLINLLDDESEEIRHHVLIELASYGWSLKDELKKQTIYLNKTQKDYLNVLFGDLKKRKFKKQWPIWMEMPFEDPYQKLEAALGTLSEFLNDFDEEHHLSHLLDHLAAEYQMRYSKNEPKQLAKFLFKEKGLIGNENDYYNPQNSNLVSVIEDKKGIPISLACVYMLVGYRLGIPIEGCHFPGHFLARITIGSEKAFIDCFSAGQIIYESDIVNIREEIIENIDQIVKQKAPVDSIVKRFLANLIRSFQIQEDDLNTDFMIEAFKDLEFHLAGQNIKNLTPEDIISKTESSLMPGQLVRHKRYGYRGIVVDVDLHCLAAESWYYGNQTQPKRNQPWVHVLVDGSDQVTYVAESNLIEDGSGDEITHPLLTYFFSQTEDGRYVRNDNPWPSSEF